MKENQKDLLERILVILQKCDPSDEKTLNPANNLITYIGRAYKKKLRLVPGSYWDFAQQMKHNYPAFKELKCNQDRLDLLQKIVKECHTTLELQENVA